MANQPYGRRTPYAAIIGVLIIACGVRLYQHGGRVHAAEQAAKVSKATADQYMRVSEKMNAAYDKIQAEIAAIKDSTSGDFDFGSMAVFHEKLEAARNDHIVNDAISFTRRTLGPSLDTKLASNLDDLDHKCDQFNDSALRISSTLQAILNNPLLALGLSGEDGSKLGANLVGSSYKYQGAVLQTKMQLTALRNDANSALAKSVDLLNAERSKNPIASIVHP